MLKLVDFICYIYFATIRKGVQKKLSRLSCGSIKAWVWVKVDKLSGGCRLEFFDSGNKGGK